MSDSQFKYLIILKMCKIVSILLIYAGLGNAQDGGKYLDLPQTTGKNYVALSEGFHPGGSITINGTINLDATRFSINFGDDSRYNFVLQIQPRFNEKRIVLYRSGGYGVKSINMTSLSRGEGFQFNILCNLTGYMIDFNENMSYFFNHLSDTSPIRKIYLSGDATFNSVLYTPGNVTCVLDGCHANAQCVSEDDDYYCKCDEGYTGPRCQVTCKHTGCTGNNICVVENEKYTCRSTRNLDGYLNNSVMCREPYIAVDTECIWVVLTKLNWDAARFKCEENEGFLFEPDFPINFMQYMSNKYPEDGSNGFWLGGADRGLDRWIWVNSLVDIQEGSFPWGEDEPNDQYSYGVKEDCMNLITQSERPYFYNDGKCNLKMYYICEAPPLTPPTPAALVADSVYLSQGSYQMQVAILLMLFIAIILIAGDLIYKNLHIFKKAYGSLGDYSISFLNHDTSKVHEEKDISRLI